jgi:hypothetical protein
MVKWKLKELFWQSAEEDELTPSEPANARESPLEAGARQRTPLVQVLELMKDVDGVVGSLAVANGGTLLGDDLPRLFDRARVARLGNRVLQLRAALAGEGAPLKSAAFRYESYDLHLSQLPWGVLGVLSEHRAESPALAMALKVVGQRVESVLAERA